MTPEDHFLYLQVKQGPGEYQTLGKTLKKSIKALFGTKRNGESNFYLIDGLLIPVKYLLQLARTFDNDEQIYIQLENDKIVLKTDVSRATINAGGFEVNEVYPLLFIT